MQVSCEQFVCRLADSGRTDAVSNSVRAGTCSCMNSLPGPECRRLEGNLGTAVVMNVCNVCSACVSADNSAEHEAMMSAKLTLLGPVALSPALGCPVLAAVAVDDVQVAAESSLRLPQFLAPVPPSAVMAAMPPPDLPPPGWV